MSRHDDLNRLVRERMEWAERALAPWAALIARYLKPGGFFYIAEAHPSACTFPLDEDLPKTGGFHPWLSYFHDEAGIRWPAGPDYADPEAMNTTAQHNWQHSMGDIVNALIGAGLAIEWLHEFPPCPWKVVAGCEVVERSDAGGLLRAPGVGAANAPHVHHSCTGALSSTVRTVLNPTRGAPASTEAGRSGCVSEGGAGEQDLRSDRGAEPQSASFQRRCPDMVGPSRAVVCGLFR